MSKPKYKWVGTRPDRPDGADKVTGRARFGADFNMPGQLVGKVLRSPHAHANIKSIDISAAEKLPGVKAVITSKDFPDQPNLIVPTGEMQVNLRSLQCRISGCDAVLVDVSLVGLRVAFDRAIADGLEQRCQMVVANGAALPFSDGSFDAVSHSDVLCCTPAKLSMLRACRRVARDERLNTRSPSA